ncbi:MAG: hypothetical protein ACK52I_01050 [Pseudomonadota bacterium]|jgi:hypothetical protein
MTTITANIPGFAVDDDGRKWNADATLGLSRDEDGRLRLLDADGSGANHALDDRRAAHILAIAMRENLDPSAVMRRWDYYASAI